MLTYQSSGLGYEPQPRTGRLCSWARQFSLTVPLYTQAHKLLLANMREILTIALHCIQGEVEKLLATSNYRNQRRIDGLMGHLTCMHGTPPKA